MPRRIVFIVAAGSLALAAAGWLAFRPSAAPPVRISFATVEEGPITAVVSSTGRLRAAGSVIVGSQLSGQISEVLVDFNSPVKRGDVLARIDPKTYEARVEQGAAQLQVAQARVAEATAQARRAQLTLTDARRDFERRRALRRSGNLSEREFEQAETRLRQAEADLAMAEAAILNAEAAVVQQRAALNQSRIDLDRTYIRSPIDGVVISREVEPGQTVAASLQAPTLFTIASGLERMEVEARVDEADIGRVRTDQPVRFTVDAFPGRTFTGTVAQIQKSPREVQSVVTYTVVIDAPNPGERLLPGLTAKLDIVLGERPSVVKVPAQALRFRPRADGAGARRGGGGAGAANGGGQPGVKVDAQDGAGAGLERGSDGAADGGTRGTVFILDADGKPQPVRLRLGLADQEWAELLEGPLKPGDQVIIRAERGESGAQRPAGLRF